MKFPITTKPTIKSELLTRGDEQLKDALQQISDLHGVGGMIPTKGGALVGIRVDTDGATPFIEVFTGGAWVRCS
jgi:hypothetical protein